MEHIIDIVEPPLRVSARTESLVRRISATAMRYAPEVVTRLLDEVDRADIVPDTELPPDVVTLGSYVTYRSYPTEVVNTVQIVRPVDADPGNLRVSIISGVGAALLGLRPGQRIQWEFGLRRHVLEVMHVSPGSEVAKGRG